MKDAERTKKAAKVRLKKQQKRKTTEKKTARGNDREGRAHAL